MAERNRDIEPTIVGHATKRVGDVLVSGSLANDGRIFVDINQFFDAWEITKERQQRAPYEAIIKDARKLPANE